MTIMPIVSAHVCVYNGIHKMQPECTRPHSDTPVTLLR